MKINVKVKPRSRINKVAETGPGQFQVWTTAAPDKGQANQAVIELLAEHLKIAKSRIVLKSGAASRHKLFEIG